MACISISISAQTVTGKITDEDGNPLIGVNIVLADGDGLGTTSDIDGNYSLNVAGADGPILFSYVGFEVQTVPINGRSTINIVLSENEEMLDEVVIIGYGEVKKRDLIGSVGTISTKQIEQQPITTYNQALAGQIAGVQVRQGTGVPGGGPEFLIRGINSISPQSAPLIVIDDIPIGNYNAERDNFLTLINPDDIESISVIKDASGKAIYGSRAANGLVIIKTKRGQPSEPTIKYNSSYGLQTIPSWEVPNIMNATELATFHRERFRDEFFLKNGVFPTEDEIPEHVRNPSQYGEGTDWFGALTQNGFMQNHNLNLSGGTKNLRYSLSAGFLDQEGVVIESGLKRYTMRLNMDAKVKPWLDLNIGLAPSWTDNRTGNTDPGSGQFSVYSVLNVARWADPTGQIYDENGNLTRDTRGVLTQFYQVNPVRYLMEQQNSKQNRSIQANIGATVRLGKGFAFRTTASSFYFNNRGRGFVPASISASGLEPAFTNTQAFVNVGRYENLRLLSENKLTYNKTFNKAHNIDGLLAYTAEWTQETTLGGSASRVINEDFILLNSGNNVPRVNDVGEPAFYYGVNEGISEQTLLSYTSRIKYNYREKYYLGVSVRADGSSRFGPGNRYGVFSAYELGYRLSDEPWFPKSDLLSNVKLEAIYGTTGANRIGNYAWRGSVGRSDYIIGGEEVNGSAVNALPNPSLKWEETKQFDLGLDIGLFTNKLNLEVDYYIANTENLLFGVPTPAVTGFGSRIDNLGAIQNKGVEVAINATPYLKKDFAWTINANFTVNRNKVLKIGAEDRPIFTIPAGNGTRAGIVQVGSPIGLFRGLKLLGLYTEEMLEDPDVPKYPGAVVGAPFYEDFDGSGTLDRNEDIQILASPWETFSFGFTNNVTWKDWNLRVVTYGNYGSKILDLSREFMQNTDLGNGDFLGVFNLDREVQGRWRPGDTDFNTIRVPSTATASSSQRWRWPNSSGIKDGSYVKIANITLTYRLTSLAKQWAFLQNASAYFSAQNVGYISPYDGNPEIRRATGGILERNVNYSSYPVPRIFTFGLNIEL